VPFAGVEYVSPEVSTMYILSVSGPGGDLSVATTVRVAGTPEPPRLEEPPIIIDPEPEPEPEPTPIQEPQMAFTISWTSAGAVRLNGQDAGSSGSITLDPTAELQLIITGSPSTDPTPTPDPDPTPTPDPDPPPTPVPTALQDGGFELPSIGPKKFAYASQLPPGSPWTFAGNAGIVSNGGGYSDGVAAPQGTQVALLQNLGTISQPVTLAAGTYRVSLMARLKSGGQKIGVQLGSTPAMTITPSGSGYTRYTTGTVALPAGTHVLTISGMTPTSVALIDDVKLELV
jgi:hypothetical protein